MSGIPERLWRVVKGHWALMRERAQNALGGDDPIGGESLADRLNAARARLEARGELDRDDLLAIDAKIEEVRAMADAYAELGRHLEQTRLPVSPRLGQLPPSAPALGSEVCDPLAVCYDLLGVRPGADLAELERAERERLRLADLWGFQRREIETAAPALGEDAALEADRRVLRNIVSLQEHAAAAYDSLYEAPNSALAQIRQGWRRLEEISRIDVSLEPLRDSLRSAEVALQEAAHELRGYLGRLEADPARLEQIEARLALLERLKRKYGPTLEQVLAFLSKVRADLEALESAEERRGRLERQREELERAYQAASGRLSESRHAAARRLERQIEAELEELAMGRSRFRIELEAAEWTAHGADRVAFLISTNPGEPPRPLEKVASGGELSRIALALKTCLARADRAAAAGRTLVFDEVDSGVGGSAAETVGRRLKQLAAADQVLCVTHLPQIAAFADHHYYVAKREEGGRSVASIEELSAEARVRELGRMLSGRRLTEEALRHAEQLLRLARG